MNVSLLHLLCLTIHCRIWCRAQHVFLPQILRFIPPCPPVRQTPLHTLASHLFYGHLTPRSYLHCLACMQQNAKPNHAHNAPGIHCPRACSSSRVPLPTAAAVAFAAVAAADVAFSAVAFSAVPLSGSVPLAARWPWCGGGVSLQSELEKRRQRGLGPQREHRVCSIVGDGARCQQSGRQEGGASGTTRSNSRRHAAEGQRCTVSRHRSAGECNAMFTQLELADRSHAGPVEDEVQPQEDAAGRGGADTAYQTLLTRKCLQPTVLACLGDPGPLAAAWRARACRRWRSKCEASAQTSAPHKAAPAGGHAAWLGQWLQLHAAQQRNAPALFIFSCEKALAHVAEPIHMNGIAPTHIGFHTTR